MKFALACLAGLAVAQIETPSNHWAVILAGSNSFWNYRHQADTHHAVKIALANGIPRDQIIHLAYDDIANSSYNPFPGQIFNKPTDAGTPGVNVYDSTEIDFRGADVNKTNFFKVLLGDESAPGPVLKSDENSRVFINFADHGGRGLICTPDDYIYADELNDTLKEMKSKGMFKELVFYMEACESGSMFPSITADDNIYAITASNASQSSWGTYCGSDAYVDGTNIGSCLGDLFSVNWMEDTDAAATRFSGGVTAESLKAQTERVTELTTMSPVCIFGDQSFTSEPIGNFQGDFEIEAVGALEGAMEKALSYAEHLFDGEKKDFETVDSRDHDLHFLYNRVVEHGTEEDYMELRREIEHRQFVDGLFGTHLPAVANAPEQPQDFDCLRQMVGQIEEICGKFSAYSLKYVANVSNACDTKTPEELAALSMGILSYCSKM